MLLHKGVFSQQRHAAVHDMTRRRYIHIAERYAHVAHGHGPRRKFSAVSQHQNVQVHLARPEKQPPLKARHPPPRVRQPIRLQQRQRRFRSGLPPRRGPQPGAGYRNQAAERHDPQRGVAFCRVCYLGNRRTSGIHVSNTTFGHKKIKSRAFAPARRPRETPGRRKNDHLVLIF